MQQISINYIVGNIMDIMEIIETSRVLDQNKITIKEKVAKLLNVKPGESVVFLRLDSGDIVIRNLLDVVITKR